MKTANEVKDELIAKLIPCSTSFDYELLSALDMDELRKIDAVDTNWCDNWESGNYGSFDSEDEAVSMAYCATYEDIIETKSN